MDHEAAIRTQAAERYILGELRSAERDDFEEHLADCSRCMEDLATLDIFAANAGGEFRAAPRAKAARKTSWRAWLVPRFTPALAFSGALNLALVCLVSYGTFGVLASLRSRVADFEQPRTVETLVVHGLSRGSEEAYQVSRGSVAPVFRFDLPQQFPSCGYSIEGGGVHRTGSLSVPRGAETVDVSVPIAGLEPGDYMIHITGSDGVRSQEVGRWTLRVVP